MNKEHAAAHLIETSRFKESQLNNDNLCLNVKQSEVTHKSRQLDSLLSMNVIIPPREKLESQRQTLF
jgi:hypothetical protein